nr:hypothetical protein [Corynebacterium lemuris]
MTPEEIEKRIREVVERLEKAPLIIKRRHEAAREAERNLRSEYARAFFEHRSKGMSLKECELQARLDTDPAREERDIAEVSLTYARDIARQLEQHLRALQTQSASLRAAFPMAGRGFS